MRRYQVRATVAAIVASVSLVAAGCTIDHDGPVQAEQQKLLETAEPTVSVKDEETGVNPRDRIKVETPGAGLTTVSMTNEAGYQVDSELSADKKSWTTTEPLGYGRTYTVKAKETNGNVTTAEFQTIAPSYTAEAWLTPVEDSTVGVGQTVAIRFSSAIADREAAEEAITVKTEPEVEGAFFWVNNSEVRWRPEEFWKAGTKVSVEANMYGVKLGDGVYGDSDVSTSFTIGDEVKTIIDDDTKMMTVYRNGDKLRSIPVSLGMAGQFATPNGYYMIGDKNESLVMDSETFGLAHEAGGYRTTVQYATQMSYSGIYVHAAPWSVWAQGSQNTSHGCVNVTTEAARWFQDTVKRGDIVEVRNTSGGTLPGYDGLGDWNIPWETWKAGNADEA